MTRKTRNWIGALFILAFPFVVFLAFLIYELNGPLPPLQPLPRPNGYDDLTRAGQQLSDTTENLAAVDEESLRAIVASNAAALWLARTGLSNECRVPLQFSRDYWTNHIQDLVALRRLAQAFAAEGRLAESEGRFRDAARTDLDAIRLGIEAGRGGTMADGMVGIAIQSFGLQPLQNISGQLDARTCRETAAALEALREQSPAWADWMQQDNAWSRRAYGWREPWLKWIHFSARKRNLQRAIDKMNSTQHDENQLMIDLAARAYELEKGRYPASPADLVPDYLKAVPQDPLTGTNLIDRS
jgi:hypothetical protein